MNKINFLLLQKQCEPNLAKEEENQVKFPISCGGLRRKIKRKLKRKRKREKMRKCCEIFEKIATNSQLLKCNGVNNNNNKETRNFACNTDFPAGECGSISKIMLFSKYISQKKANLFLVSKFPTFFDVS